MKCVHTYIYYYIQFLEISFNRGKYNVMTNNQNNTLRKMIYDSGSINGALPEASK